MSASIYNAPWYFFLPHMIAIKGKPMIITSILPVFPAERSLPIPCLKLRQQPPLNSQSHPKNGRGSNQHRKSPKIRRGTERAKPTNQSPVNRRARQSRETIHKHQNPNTHPDHALVRRDLRNTRVHQRNDRPGAHAVQHREHDDPRVRRPRLVPAEQQDRRAQRAQEQHVVPSDSVR